MAGPQDGRLAKGWAGRLALWLALVGGALAGMFALAVRLHLDWALDLVRRVNKRVVNPVALSLAGRPFSRLARVEHVGRRSGQRYETPVIGVPVTDGFVIALPYGSGTDWCRNVLAAGGGRLTFRGTTYEIRQPRVVGPAEALPLLPRTSRAAFRLFDIREFLRLTV